MIGFLGAVLCLLPGILLGPDSPAMALAIPAIPIFFGCLIIGPLWTLRRLRR